MSGFRAEKLDLLIGPKDKTRANLIKENYVKSLNRDREYLPEDFCRLLADDLNRPELYSAVLGLYYGLENQWFYSDSIYPETLIVLEKLKNEYRLGIYSEGTYKFQNHKFNSMGISKYFDKELVFIVPAKDTPDVIARIPRDSLVVDDKEIICDFLHTNKIDCVWVNKKDKRKSDKYKTIQSLLELPAIIN